MDGAQAKQEKSRFSWSFRVPHCVTDIAQRACGDEKIAPAESQTRTHTSGFHFSSPSKVLIPLKRTFSARFQPPQPPQRYTTNTDTFKHHLLSRDGDLVCQCPFMVMVVGSFAKGCNLRSTMSFQGDESRCLTSSDLNCDARPCSIKSNGPSIETRFRVTPLLRAVSGVTFGGCGSFLPGAAVAVPDQLKVRVAPPPPPPRAAFRERRTDRMGARCAAAAVGTSASGASNNAAVSAAAAAAPTRDEDKWGMWAAPLPPPPSLAPGYV